MLIRSAALFASLLCVSFVHAANSPLSERASLQSPALVKLTEALDRGDRAALDKFWASVAEKQAPLIEELSDRPNDALYTFLWRAESKDSEFAVRLTASFPKRNKTGLDKLTSLANSDVWYASYALPKRATIGYGYVVPVSANSNAQVIGVEERAGIKYGLYRDPFNPKTVAAIGAVISFVEGPTAESSPYLEASPGVARGRITSMDIESKLLATQRHIEVYTPAGYRDSSTPYRFMLMFDGDEYTKSIPTPRILDNMIARKAIPPVVVAFFHSPDRDRDLLPNDVFQKFLAEELLPYLRERYRISREPNKNIVAGFSLGGLAATYSALKNPAIFGNVIAQSGSFWWSPQFWDAPDYAPGQFLNSNSGGLIKTFAESPRMPIRLYLEAGEWEEAGSLLPTRLLASVLKGKGYQISYSEYLGAHDSYSWKQTLPNALVYVLSTTR